MHATIPTATPRRRSWARRHKLATLVLIAAAAAVAGVIALRVHHALAPQDYRDPAVLASAVRDHEQGATGKHAVSASCGKISAVYVCSVGFSDLTTAAYQVTVAGDGSSFTVSP